MRILTSSEIAKNRLYNSGLLHNKFSNAPVAASALFGIQSQYQQFGEISLFNRVSDVTKEVLQNDYDQKKLIKIWGQRMTVHMYTPSDWFFIHEVYASRNNWIKKHTEELGSNIDTLLAEMELLLMSDEKIPKEAFAKLFGEQAKKLMTWGGVFIQGSLDGKLYCVPESPKTKFYSHRYWINSETEESWLSTPHMQTGLEVMVDRYFSAYGPATVRDFKHWSGLPIFEFQATLGKLLPTYFYYLGEDGEKYYSKTEIQLEVKSEKPILLGKFDPLFVSYRKKDWLANEKETSLIWRTAGQIEAVLIINENFYGTWRYEITGEKIAFHFYLSKKLARRVQKQVEKEAIQLAIFLSKNYQGSTFEQI